MVDSKTILIGLGTRTPFAPPPLLELGTDNRLYCSARKLAVKGVREPYILAVPQKMTNVPSVIHGNESGFHVLASIRKLRVYLCFVAKKGWCPVVHFLTV